MNLSLDDNPATYQIRGFKPGMIRINNQTYTHSLIITAEKLIEPWTPQRITELKIEHLAEAMALQPTILLIGTGETLFFPPIELYGSLINQGIGVEIMNTASACHTYNALTSENRNVAAALIIQ